MLDNRSSLPKKMSMNFGKIYAGQKPAFVSRASGRVELIGGHTDYNEGFVIAAAIDSSAFVAAAKRDDNIICLYSEWARQRHEFELPAFAGTSLPLRKQGPALEPSQDCQWANYGRGVAAYLCQEGLHVKGANLYIASDVPVGAGLSSSAALEVSLAKAMIHLSKPDWQIQPKRLAQICQKAENVYAKSPCGILDQITAVTATKDHVILLDCRDVSVRLLPFDSNACSIMIFNSMVKHEIGGGEYGKRRRQCEEACAVIAKKYPQVRALRDADQAMLDSVKNQLDNVQFLRASHVIGENARVLAAAEALKQNDIEKLGRLMNESHCSARDLYQISCEQTDFLAEQLWKSDGAYGARLCGGGFGGSVVALVQPDAAAKINKNVRKAYKDRFDLDCDVYLAKPWQGTEIIDPA
jgi:galactokinase